MRERKRANNSRLASIALLCNCVPANLPGILLFSYWSSDLLWESLI